MPAERSPVLHDLEIGKKFRLERNSVFRAYEKAFRVMFEEFNGIPQGEHQKKWYVGRRWDRRTRSCVEAGKAESRLVSFLNPEQETPRRTLRVVYGRTGTGKTTFLRYFFFTYLPAEHPQIDEKIAPILIDCADAALSVEGLEPDVDRRVHDCLKKSERYRWLEKDPH